MSDPKTVQSPDNDKVERRAFIGELELRAAPAGSSSPGTLVGYAAVFERYSADLGYFREKIQRGAFAKAIAANDVRALVNHDPNQLLGRKSAGTLRMAEDEVGLRVEIDLPDNTVGRDTAVSIGRRDMQGQSFSFTTAIDQWDWTGETALRTVVEVDDLFDVGPVTFPAYEETSIALRSFHAAREQRQNAQAGAAPTDPPSEPDPRIACESESDQARLRLLEVS